MQQIKKLTILHSNDLHGDFLAERIDDKLIGGISRLSGYIQKVREEEANVLYTISGDMFRGSEIDSEYKGLSTIELMNMLAPDVATIGNHEVDYGIGHLLFLEKCARFPIINANMYLKTNQIRLFHSHLILETGGMKVMFIGVITKEVLAQTKQDSLLGDLIDVHEAVAEIGKICNVYRTEEVDFTVLLTHIGFEEDKKLAAMLKPEWGIDVIIGGHTHTFLEEPCMIQQIPIVQAAMGTDQIGRFDFWIDTEKKSASGFQWSLVPIDEDHCPRDQELEKLLNKYLVETEEKYGRYITRFAQAYTHPARNRETQLGRIFADVFRENLGLDIMMLASGSIRLPKLGPLVAFRDLNQVFPFHDEIVKVTVNGEQLKRMIFHIYRPEILENDHSEFYQYSGGLKVIVSKKEQAVKEITFGGEAIEDTRIFRIGLQGFHFRNLKEFFGLTLDEVEKNSPCKILATNSMDVLDESLSRRKLVICPTDERWIIVD